MLEIGFGSILLHILNIVLYIAIAAWVVIGLMWLTHRMRGRRRA